MIQVVLLLLVGLFSVIYLYFYYTYKYWLNKGIPQETPTFLVGNLLDVVLNRKNTGWIYNELYLKYKDNDAVGMYEFQTPKLLVRSPKLFETILIKDFSSFTDNEIYTNSRLDPFLEHNAFTKRGEKWKTARSSVINGMTKSKLKDMYELMKQTVPRLKSYVDENLDKDMKAQELALLFMMTNFSNSVYGIDSNCFTDTDATIRKMFKLFSQDHWQKWWKVIIIFYMQRTRDILGYTYVPKQVSIFVENMVRQVVDARIKSNTTRKDYMNYYLNLNKPLEERTNHIIKNAMSLFINGFETSSVTSGNLIYELALNPTIQDNLFRELEAAYEGKSELDYDTLMTLPLLDRAFKETLRKHPVFYAAMKMCTKPTTLEIDGKQVKIDKGIPVLIPVHAMQHDPQHYPDPEVFDPDRFSEEAIKSRHPCTWLPFGDGPRICAGMNFGLLQSKLLLASVIYDYKIVRTDKTPPKISLKKSAILAVPAEDQWIRLERRR